jgi:Uma2 family endonuclease
MGQMPFLINDANLPATLTAQPMTDEEFAAFCAEHPDLNFEMTAEAELIVMPPTHSWSGAGNSDVDAQLSNWARKDRRGVVCDSSTGFVLPNGARRSPDASWTLKNRVQQLGAAKKIGFWHLCPDFMIEIKSGTDRWKLLQQKMREYLEQGAQLRWLIDPEKKSVEIYRPNGDVEARTGIDKLEGEGLVAGFVLNLTYVWDPLAD